MAAYERWSAHAKTSRRWRVVWSGGVDRPIESATNPLFTRQEVSWRLCVRLCAVKVHSFAARTQQMRRSVDLSSRPTLYSLDYWAPGAELCARPGRVAARQVPFLANSGHWSLAWTGVVAGCRSRAWRNPAGSYATISSLGRPEAPVLGAWSTLQFSVSASPLAAARAVDSMEQLPTCLIQPLLFMFGTYDISCNVHASPAWPLTFA